MEQTTHSRMHSHCCGRVPLPKSSLIGGRNLKHVSPCNLNRWRYRHVYVCMYVCIYFPAPSHHPVVETPLTDNKPYAGLVRLHFLHYVLVLLLQHNVLVGRAGLGVGVAVVPAYQRQTTLLHLALDLTKEIDATMNWWWHWWSLQGKVLCKHAAFTHYHHSGKSPKTEGSVI